MARKNLAWMLGIANAVAWILVLVVLVRVDSIGEGVAILEEADIWLLMIAAIVGLLSIVISIAGRATDTQRRQVS